MSNKQYAERDASDLDEKGGYYTRHVMAMTSEHMHSKSSIAAELGWRDMRIDKLTAALNVARDYLGDQESGGIVLLAIVNEIDEALADEVSS